MEKFPSLENFYTHAVTGVTDNYQVWLYPLALGWVKTQKVGPATWPLDRALLFLLCSGQAGKFAVFCNQSVVSLCCESSTFVWLFSTVRILCGTGVSRLKSKYRKWQTGICSVLQPIYCLSTVSCTQWIGRADNETSATDKLSDKSLHNVDCHTSNRAMLPLRRRFSYSLH